MIRSFLSGRSVAIVLTVILSLLLALPLCAEEKPRYGGVLRNVEGAGPAGSLGWPAKAVGNDALAMKPNIECLIYEETSGKLHPWLATDWKVADDKSSLTFVLRKGVKFHDGSDFNAEVARFNLQAQLDAKQSGTRSWESIEVVDDYTVRINLKEYQNTMMGLLSGGLGAMVSRVAVEKNGEDWAKLNPVGTGPFVFVSFQRDVVTKFKRNENYWDKGKPYLDAIELHYIKDPMTQMSALRAGEAEVIGMDVGKRTADMQALGFTIIAEPSGTVTLIPDSANPDSPFADKRVREAVSYAIDRDAITKAKGYGFFHSSYQLPHPISVAAVPNLQGRSYNPEKAKQLLAAAGFPKGFKTKIIPMPFGIDRDVMVAVQSYLGEVGIQVDLDFVDYGRYSEYRMKGWKDGLLCQPLGMFPNFNTTLDWYFSEKSPQFPSLKRADGYQAILEASLATIEPVPELMQKAVKKIFDDAMIIPIHDTGRAYVTQPYVHDTGHLAWGAWPNWRPDRTWLSK